MSTDDERGRGRGPGASGGHRELRERLGAYVLGALGHDERLGLEQHLDGCSACRDEVSRLSALPPLLDRVSPEEATARPLRPPAGLLDDVLARIDRERRHERRRLRVWQAAAAGLTVAAVAVVALWAPWQGQPTVDAVVAPAEAVVASVDGQAELMAWEWGTTVRLEVIGLPARDAYVLWAVAVDGRRQQAGTWGPTADRSARVIGASAILREALARVEVTDPSGEVLAVFEPEQE